MTYEERLANVTVLGAAGKMGSGILLLTAMEMADLKLQPEHSQREFALNAVDISNSALTGLMCFLQVQVRKAAEKKAVWLRQVYSERGDLIENVDIIDQYISDVLNLVRPSTRLENAYESTLIFEAIKEDPELKVKILSGIDRKNSNKPYYFTNTSSIPISELDRDAQLEGRILGFHFYNPPAVQKLVELIAAEATQKGLTEFATTYAKKLRKKVVPSNDTAGFIGNGHFMREILLAYSEVERLVKEEQVSSVEAIHMVNLATQEYLVRPMGIFQLVDYVGIDVCQFIMQIMDARLPGERIESRQLDDLLKSGIRGGQFADGSQKDGIMKYSRGRPTAVYNIDSNEYQTIDSFREGCDLKMGQPPDPAAPAWKSIIGNPARDDILNEYFVRLRQSQSTGADLARRFSRASRQIAAGLVSAGVAANEQDVNTVLLTGFYHAYGPINNFLSQEVSK